jgi:hypothetical protein
MFNGVGRFATTLRQFGLDAEVVDRGEAVKITLARNSVVTVGPTCILPGSREDEVNIMGDSPFAQVLRELGAKARRVEASVFFQIPGEFGHPTWKIISGNAMPTVKPEFLAENAYDPGELIIAATGA